MSDEELIEDARKWIRLHENNKYQREAATRMRRLTNRLEATIKEMHARELHHFETEKLLTEAGIDPDTEHTASTGDEAWVDDDLYGVIDRAMQRSWTDTAEYEYATSQITDAVRTWMDEQRFRRVAAAEPAVTDEMLLASLNAWFGVERAQANFPHLDSTDVADYSPQTQDRMRAALEAALSTERSE